MTGVVAPCDLVYKFLPDADSGAVYSAACAAGVGSSCHRLGSDTLNAWIKDGRSDAALLERATDLFDQGCGHGDALSCHTLEHLSKG
jgi:TPR repeat protein